MSTVISNWNSSNIQENYFCHLNYGQQYERHISHKMLQI
jgi:hypothetical protein